MIEKTTTALLEDLQDPANQDVWEELDGRYRPILFGFAKRLGLGDEDAADAAQEALGQFVKAYRSGGFDREKGRLRSWLFGIARNCAMDIRQQRINRREQRGVSALGDETDQERMSQVWDLECKRALLARAMVELRKRTSIDEKTIRAFELVAFEQVSPAAAATELGISTNDVYLAKHRCLKRLREILSKLDDLYELR